MSEERNWRAERLIFGFEKTLFVMGCLGAAGVVLTLVGAWVEHNGEGLIPGLIGLVASIAFFGLSRAFRAKRRRFSDGRVKPIGRWT